jgi:hypothetical protein
VALPDNIFNQSLKSNRLTIFVKGILLCNITKVTDWHIHYWLPVLTLTSYDKVSNWHVQGVNSPKFRKVIAFSIDTENFIIITQIFNRIYTLGIIISTYKHKVYNTVVRVSPEHESRIYYIASNFLLRSLGLSLKFSWNNLMMLSTHKAYVSQGYVYAYGCCIQRIQNTVSPPPTKNTPQ